MTKTDYTGIYLIGDIPEKDSIRGAYRFIIRRTVTVSGVGKKTVKETFKTKGTTFKKALELARDERPMMRERAIKKLSGIADPTVINKHELQPLDDVWTKYVAYRSDKTTPKFWSDTNIRVNKNIYKNHIQPYIGTKKAINVGYTDIENCILNIRKKKLSARMEEHVVTLMKTMFTWWFKRNKLMDVKTNPAKDQDIHVSNPREVNVAFDDMQKLFEAMYNYENEKYRQVWIWISTGRRINEVLSLKHEDLDGNYYTIKSENNKVRKPMIHRIPNGATLPLYKGYMHSSPRDRDKQLNPVTVDNQWKKLVKRLGLEGTRKHDIRHFIETVLSDSEVPQQTINLVLGHLEAGASKNYKNDTTATADRKHRAVTFFLDKVFNRIDRDMLWNKYS